MKKYVTFRQLQQFPFAFSNSCIDFPGIPVLFYPPPIIRFDRTYHVLSLTNFQSYECDKQFTLIYINFEFKVTHSL